LNKQPNLPWDKLAQYFAGELTGEEKRTLETWIKADPERTKHVEKIYEIWKESESFPYYLNTDEAWKKLSFSMDEMDLVKTGRTVASKRDANLYTLPSVKKFRRAGFVARRVALTAAAVLIVVTAGLLALHYQSAQESGLADEVMNRVIMTSFGERASYILNDGTRVVLHAGSRLEIPENYNKEIRQLYLEGEAYFETVHNPDKPFIVHSKHAYTRVVGTRFLVQAWTESYHKVEVVVSEGKVLFGDRRAIGTSLESREVLIAENQRAVLSENEMPLVTEVEEIDWYLGWTEGRLVFEDRPLREVLPRLERWYNITFQVANEAILAQNITAEIDYSLPMSDVLNGIALTLGLEIERTENRLYVFR